MLCAVNGSARRIALASDEHAIFQCCRRSPFVLVGCFNLGCASRCGNLECGGLCVKCAWRSGERRRHRARLALLRRARTASAARPLVRSVERFQRTGNHRAAARTRRAPATNRLSGDDVARPVLSGGGQSRSAAQPLAIFPRDASDAAALASTVHRKALDVHTSSRPPAPRPRAPSVGPPYGAREPAVGLSTRRRRTEGPRQSGVGDHGAHLASESRPRTGRYTRCSDLARVLASALANHHGGRLLHRRGHVVATAVRAVLR